MKITIYDIIGYVFKWKFLVLVLVVFSLVLCKYYTDSNQSYTAETVIKYTDPNAKSGQTPNGNKLDVYEILSPNIINEAISELNVNISVENVRSHCAILPIVPTAEVEMKKTKLKNGEEYEFNPTEYIIKYTVDSSKNGGYARDMLDAIIKNYSIFYNEKYLTQSVLAQIDFDAKSEEYDYLELAEIMSAKVNDSLLYMEGKAVASADFRSTSTGYSFGDLKEKYDVLKNCDLPTLFSHILVGQITKNEEILLKKYEYKKQQLWLLNQSKITDTATAFELMNEFVNSNKEVPNSYNNKENNNDTQFNNNNIFINKDKERKKTTYDLLVDSYVTDGVKSGEYAIDVYYNQAIIDTFSKPADPNLNHDELVAMVNDDIAKIYDKMSKLFIISDKTIGDFNRVNAAKNIQMLSGVTMSENLPVTLYQIIACAMGLLLGMIFAITIEITRKIKREK